MTMEQAIELAALQDFKRVTQERVTQLCRAFRHCSQQPSLRTPDPANQAFTKALWDVMDTFNLDDAFTIDAGES